MANAKGTSITMKFHPPVLVAAAALAIAGCVAPAPHAAAGVAGPLAPPPGQELLLKAFATGVQKYECIAGKAGPEWAFRGPEAVLADSSGRRIGTHFGGPTWEYSDGSKVVAQVVASAESTDGNAIAHLLLKSTSNSGAGRFAGVRSIQRLETTGGRAPKVPCRLGDPAQQVRVPYSATYYFYGEAPVRGAGAAAGGPPRYPR